ncbi:hypothetical protein AYO49_01165 [Verrucomicrobiaceae bacterium SCGC AG-212-N21]|nr:hypothetical protein AYO49_01165 [Verrucomicrobiaceae bacterium SCGC AG-212-N21]
MKSLHAYLALVLLWACVYLPGLGSREIRGEEWRRTLPARTMLNTGEWIVPWSGGLPYVRKPPLILWVNAASFKLTGVQNEWTARLPGVLLMLGAALGIYACSRRFMGNEAAFVGCVFFLTCAGSLEKGRIAEIEVYYIALTGLAFAAWLAGFMGKLNRWLAWLIAGFCLGLACLAKGPVHLLFFYFLVIGACWTTKRWRELLSAPHFAGLALCAGMFLAWGIPFMQRYGQLIEAQPWLVEAYGRAVAAGAPAEMPKGAFASWWHELTSRVTGEEPSSTKDWLVRGPRAIVMFLPWALFIPWWWKKNVLESAFPDDDKRKVYRGLCWGVVAGFAMMVLLPSSSPRYVAPLFGPVAVLLGWLVTRQTTYVVRANTIWRWIARLAITLSMLVFAIGMFITFAPPTPALPAGWQLLVIVIAGVAAFSTYMVRRDGEDWRAPVRSCFLTIGAFAFLMLAYSWLSPAIYGRKDDIRPTGVAMRDAIQSKDAPLYIFHLGQQPYSFYLPEDSIELYDLQQLPGAGVRWMLTSKKVSIDFGPWFERRYGATTKVGEWTGAWGDKDQDEARNMVLLRFAGRPASVGP